MASGLIYILINPSFRNLLKIGKTTRTSEERALEISVSTGVPTKFLVAYDQHTEDCDLAEKLIHERLRQQRHGKDREFFELDLKDAIPIIVEVIKSVDRDVKAKREQVRTTETSTSRGNGAWVNGVKIIDRASKRVEVRCQRCDRHFAGLLTQKGAINCPHCESKHYIDVNNPHYYKNSPYYYYGR